MKIYTVSLVAAMVLLCCSGFAFAYDEPKYDSNFLLCVFSQNQAKRAKRLKIKHPLKPKDFGYIVSDTVERVTDGIKDYFYNV